MRISSAIISSIFCLISGTSFAAITPAGTCASGSVLFDGTSGASLTTSTACEVYTGNDKNLVGPGSTDAQPFGISDWTLAWSSDDGQVANQPDFGLAGDFVGTDGTWSVNSFLNYSQIMIVLKAGPDFASYLIDVASTSGLWTTDGVLENTNGTPFAVSHISFYFAGTPSTAPVPLPAALPLFLSGIAAAAYGRRKKKMSA